MTSNQIRKAYLDFFTDVTRHHQEIPPAPLVPPDDPTTLFTSSGMQQLVPFLKGETHPMGKRLVNSQPCFRAEDIDEIGDNRHTTFFEMLGNWSLGDYVKDDQIDWFFSFLVNKLKLDATRLYVTIFKGDNFAPKDSEAEKIWVEQFQQIQSPFSKIGIDRITVNKTPEKGIKKTDRIFYYPAENNWWSRSGTPEKMPVGEIGGPDSEVFYDFDPDEKLKLHENSKWAKTPCHPNCDCERFLEIGNSVFMQYEKQKDGGFKELPKLNVDFGGGLERLAAAVNNNPDIFKIDTYAPIVNKIREFYFSGINDSENIDDRSFYATNPELHNDIKSQKEDKRIYKESVRIIADHLKASVFLIADGVEPSNQAAGNVLRKLIRRAMVRFIKISKIKFEDFYNQHKLSDFVDIISTPYKNYYPKLKETEMIKKVIDAEQDKFQSNMKTAYPAAIKVFSNSEKTVSGEEAFNLFQTHGLLPIVLKELELRFNKTIDWKKFDTLSHEHSKKSRTSSAGMFKGGLADHSEAVVKLHTATHLLHASLRKVLGPHVRQEGSNITSERLRFDFSHPQALTAQEIASVEKLINQKIKEDLPVVKMIEDKDKALKSGAMAFFRETYPDKVSVYTIADFSKEICGGPHVASTGQIGNVKIIKDEATGAGKRRLYAVINYGNKKHLQKTQAGQSSR